MNFQKLLFLFLLVLFFKLGNAFANHQGGPLYGVTIPVGFNATGENVKNPNFDPKIGSPAISRHSTHGLKKPSEV